MIEISGWKSKENDLKIEREIDFPIPLYYHAGMPASIFAISLGVLASLTGLLLAKITLSKRLVQVLIAMGAGIMTSISLTHILPEVSETEKYAGILFFIGFCTVFLLDYLQCTHPHEGHEDEHTHGHDHNHTKKSVWNFSGLFIHTLFDGVAIVGAFGISSLVGTIVTAGVILHQVPVSLSLAAIAQHSHFTKGQIYLLF